MTDREFWERCGLDAARLPCPIIDCNEMRSQERCGDCHVIWPDITLDNLFRYAVPVIRTELNGRESRYPFHNFLRRWVYAIAIRYEDPAQALREAIEKAWEE